MAEVIEQVNIIPEVRRKMQAYINGCPQEISGLGTVDVVEGQVFITDIFLIKQKVAPGHTELNKVALADFMVALHQKGIKLNKLKWWWHSHVNMGCHWSPTDDGNIDRFRPKDFFISTVGNKRGESKTRIDIYDPLRVTVDNIPLVNTVSAEDKVLRKLVEAEIKEKVQLTVFKQRHCASSVRSSTIFQLGSKTNTTKALEEKDEDIFTVVEYTAYANGMSMTLDELLEQEGKEVLGDWVVDAMDFT